MELLLVCPECRCQHTEPGDARLGHLVVCLHCATVDAERVVTIEVEVLATSVAA
jgi:hypothetical protein